MKNIKNKLAIITIVCVMMSTLKISIADETKNELYVTDDLVVDCNTTEVLYNTDDDIIAYYMEGKSGYAIIGINGDLIEYTEDYKIDDFDYNDDEKLYYAGVGAYYKEMDSSDKLKNISTDEVVYKEDVNNVEIDADVLSKKVNDYKGINISNDKKSVTITYPKGIKDPYGNSTYTDTFYKTLTLQKYGSISHHTRYFDLNNGGICGSCATAIMMYYYYDHIDNSYIKNKSYQGKSEKEQKAFVNHLKSVIGDNGKGTGYKKLKDGINKYLGEIGKSKNCKSVEKQFVNLETVSSKIETVIDNKKPCIIGLKGEPKYGNHWTVGGGYARYYGINGHSRNRVYFIKVNNGWYDNREQSIVYVNYKYVDGLLYLD